jgi:hypothetical protein
MRKDYFQAMGWDRETGRPSPGALAGLGLNIEV